METDVSSPAALTATGVATIVLPSASRTAQRASDKDSTTPGMTLFSPTNCATKELADFS